MATHGKLKNGSHPELVSGSPTGQVTRMKYT
jgi:hypothetical protein